VLEYFLGNIYINYEALNMGINAKYLGNLRVECTHEQNGSKIITDAPLDSGGKGESFSPTDLCAVALATCAMTTMGMYGDAHGCDVTGATVHVEKKMGTNPHRIVSIEVAFTFPDKEYTDRQKAGLERVARICPVHNSLHPDIEQNFSFKWVR
jgi:uncharacterized OsmC-like protein